MDRYGFSTWIRDLVRTAGGKFLIGLSIASAIVTVLVASVGIWKEAVYVLPAVALIALIVAAYDLHRRNVLSIPGLTTSQKGVDFFLAAPMAGTNNEEEYQEIRDSATLIKRKLSQNTFLKTYYWAGENIDTKMDFDPEDHALIENFAYLIRSRFFIFLFPRQSLSSVLVEFGFAYAHQIPTVIFVKNRMHLPYVMREASQAAPWIQLYESKDQDFLSYIENTIERHIEKKLKELELAIERGK